VAFLTTTVAPACGISTLRDWSSLAAVDLTRQLLERAEPSPGGLHREFRRFPGPPGD